MMEVIKYARMNIGDHILSVRQPIGMGVSLITMAKKPPMARYHMTGQICNYDRNAPILDGIIYIGGHGELSQTKTKDILCHTNGRMAVPHQMFAGAL
jgi:hypothetical protein